MAKLRELPFELANSGDFDGINRLDVMPGYLLWAGLGTECPFHNSSGKRSLWVFRNEWSARKELRFKCRSEACGAGGDVIQLHYQLIREAGLAPDGWNLRYACADLFRRIEAGQIALDAQLDINPHDPLPRSDNSLLHRLREYKQQLAAAKAKGRVGEVSLPKGIRLSVAEVLRGLYAEQEKGIMLKRRTDHTCSVHPVSEWLRRYREWKVAEMGFTVQTYCTGAHSDEFDQRREYAVIESDQLAPEQQLWVVRELAREHRLKCACHSGGRSVHGWFVVADYTPDEVLALYKQAVDLTAGRLDPKTYYKGQLVRLPNGWNHKTNRKQTLLIWNQ
jgi:hypothetical protein